MKYICEDCGQEHDSFPALAFGTPYHYHTLSQKEKREIAGITSDFCVIQHGDQIDRFIRCVMFQKINDACRDLEYGVWVSLSESSFEDYREHFDDEVYEQRYFGWFSNRIPEYEDTLNIRTDVLTRNHGQRPLVVLQEKNDFDNPFVRDYFEGISEEEAIRRVQQMMGNRG